MNPPERRPLAAMHSREPHSIRFTTEEWQAITESALSRGLEPSVFARMLALYALSIADAPVVTQGSIGMPGQMLGGAPQMLAAARRMRRF
jgi:hypothetical protein